jgi:hypothetical protein
MRTTYQIAFTLALATLSGGVLLAGCGGGPGHITLCSSDGDCQGGLTCQTTIQSSSCNSMTGCSCDVVQRACTKSCTTDADCVDALFGDKPSSCMAASACPGPNNLCQ